MNGKYIKETEIKNIIIKKQSIIEIIDRVKQRVENNKISTENIAI